MHSLLECSANALAREKIAETMFIPPYLGKCFAMFSGLLMH